MILYFQTMSDSTVVCAPFEIAGGSGERIHGDLRHLPGAGSGPVVIVSHGFMAFKDWGFFPHVGRSLAQAGFTTLTFNFSHNGVSAGGGKITDFDRFARNTYSGELRDLGALIDALSGGGLGGSSKGRDKIILLGHSRGGAISVLRAGSDRRVQGLVSWSSVATLDRWTPHQKERWRREGQLPLARDTSASPLRLGIGLLEDLEINRAALSVLRAARGIRIPWLIVHGRADVTVPPREAEMLYAEADKATTDLRMLEGVGHLYNGASPEEDGFSTIDRIIALTTHWLRKHFS